MSKNNQNDKQIEAKTLDGVSISPEVLARFRPASSEYTTASDFVLKFRPISSGVLDRVQERIAEQEGEPQPPMIEIDHGKGRTSLAPDLSNDWYLLQHAKWRGKCSRKLAVWVYSVSVDIDAPNWRDADPKGVFYNQMLLEDPDLDTKDPNMYKYLYICSILDGEEYSFLFEAIIGQATITRLGLQEAAADFPGKG